MNLEDFELIYREILRDFGFDRKEDERSARALSKLLENRVPIIHKLRSLTKGKRIIICGNAPSLREELQYIDISGHLIMAADGATSVLLDYAILPEIVVTDLDGEIDDIISADRLGASIVVHAHGDNIPAIREYVPRLNNVIGSTQSKPIKNVHNFGGFTDGDRCVFLAHHLGAKGVTLIGFDFEDDDVDEVKRKKLQWAKRLIKMCEF